MLRLAGSSATKEVKIAQAKTKMEAPNATFLLQEKARKLILEHVVAGKTVREWLQSSDAQSDEPLGSTKAFSRCMTELSKINIVALKNGEYHGLSNGTYGTVCDGSILLRRIPELKKLDIDLTMLPLYY